MKRAFFFSRLMGIATCAMATGFLFSCGADTTPTKVISIPETFTTKADASTDVVHASFTIKNQFHAVAHVVNIIPSCKCLTVAPFETDIPAGGDVEVQVDVDLRGHEGPEEKDVVLELEGVPQNELTLLIHILRD